MVFNKRDRYEYELVELTDEDVSELKSVISTLNHGNKDVKPDIVIQDTLYKNMLAYYFGTYVLNKELTYNPLDNSIKLHIPKEFLEMVFSFANTGMIVFVSKIDRLINGTNERFNKNLVGWYDQAIFLKKDEDQVV